MYEINFKFMQYSDSCLWSVNDAAYKKFGMTVDFDNLSISDELKSLLREVMEIHDEHFKESREDYVFKKGERQVFREKFGTALKQLRAELGGEYTIIDCCSGDI